MNALRQPVRVSLPGDFYGSVLPTCGDAILCPPFIEIGGQTKAVLTMNSVITPEELGQTGRANHERWSFKKQKTKLYDRGGDENR